MFRDPVMRFMFKIQVWDSDFGSKFVIQVWDSGFGFRFGMQGLGFRFKSLVWVQV